jgi:hypothetical protein
VKKGIDLDVYFNLEPVQKRLANYDTRKPPEEKEEEPYENMIADIIIMLSLRPAEFMKLKIQKYSPQEPPPKWWVPGSEWYITGYKKSRGQEYVPREYLSMEKNPERAKELLEWAQEAVRKKNNTRSGQKRGA